MVTAFIFQLFFIFVPSSWNTFQNYNFSVPFYVYLLWLHCKNTHTLKDPIPLETLWPYVISSNQIKANCFSLQKFKPKLEWSLEMVILLFYCSFVCYYTLLYKIVDMVTFFNDHSYIVVYVVVPITMSCLSKKFSWNQIHF